MQNIQHLAPSKPASPPTADFNITGNGVIGGTPGTNGFTLNFGTPAPGGQTVDWIVVR